MSGSESIFKILWRERKFPTLSFHPFRSTGLWQHCKKEPENYQRRIRNYRATLLANLTAKSKVCRNTMEFGVIIEDGSSCLVESRSSWRSQKGICFTIGSSTKWLFVEQVDKLNKEISDLTKGGNTEIGRARTSGISFFVIHSCERIVF